MSLLNIIITSKSLPIDARMDLIYDHIDNRMSLNEWNLLDQELVEIINNIGEVDLDVLLGVACASLPGEYELASRAEFMAKCKELHPHDYLWHGL